MDDPMNIEQDFWLELAQIQAESIGWMLNGIQNWAILKRICIQIWATPIAYPA